MHMRRIGNVAIGMVLLLASGCGSATAKTAEPAGEAERACAGGLRQANGYDQAAELVVARATTAGALAEWQASRGGLTNSQWSQRPTDEPVTVCGYEGNFSSAPAPGAPGAVPARTHLLFVVDAGGRFTPDRIGDEGAVDVSGLG